MLSRALAVPPHSTSQEILYVWHGAQLLAALRVQLMQYVWWFHTCWPVPLSPKLCLLISNLLHIGWPNQSRNQCGNNVGYCVHRVRKHLSRGIMPGQAHEGVTPLAPKALCHKWFLRLRWVVIKLMVFFHLSCRNKLWWCSFPLLLHRKIDCILPQWVVHRQICAVREVHHLVEVLAILPYDME